MNINEYKESLANLGSKPGLEAITELLNRLSISLGLSRSLQDMLPSIHIAGTNGKGTTGTLIASIFTHAGFKVGHFSSPAVMHYEEMFAVDGESISKRDLEEIFSQVEDIASQMESHPTLFEIETAAAFLYFYKAGCQVNVIECGMGGMLDATNIMSNKLANVFTPISFDHMSFLGSSIEEIVHQKAGIMQENVPSIICQVDNEVLELLSIEAANYNSPVYIARQSDRRCERVDISDRGISQSFEYEDINVTINLAGTYQLDNAILAIKVSQIIGERFPEFKVSEGDITKGLLAVRMPGRLELIANNPLFYIDGAHNPAAALRLRESIQMYFTNRRLIFIIGVLADKEYDKVLEIMAPLADEIYTITPPSNRALGSVDLALCAMKYAEKVKACESIYEACKYARESASNQDVILAFGSLSYLSKIKETVGEYNGRQ